MASVSSLIAVYSVIHTGIHVHNKVWVLVFLSGREDYIENKIEQFSYAKFSTLQQNRFLYCNSVSISMALLGIKFDVLSVLLRN